MGSGPGREALTSCEQPGIVLYYFIMAYYALEVL